MSDTLDAPRKNRFDAFDPGLAPDAPPVAPRANRFDSFPDVDQVETSTAGAFASHAASSALPAAAGLTAAGYGAAQGAELGALAGPWGALAGGLVGGIGGFMGASYATEGVQNWAVKQAPTSWQDALGQSDREQRLQEQQHPYASFLGGLFPVAVTMSPGGLSRAAAALPENATAFQRIMANPATSRLFGGGAMGGMELGQEEWNGETPNWAKVGIATGFGVVFNKPTRFGEYLTNVGHEAAVTFGPLRPKPVTLAEAGDLGVMGPGITESTFMGGHEQSPESKITAQNTRSDEIALTEPPPEPDLNAIARRIDPETMARNDDLLQRREDLLAFIKEQSNPTDETFNDLDARQYAAEEALRNANPNGPAAKNFRAELSSLAEERTEMERRRDAYGTEGYVETPDVALARQHLMATEHELWDHAPAVRATLRRAAEHAGQQIEEPVTEAATEETPAAETPTTGALTPAVRMADGTLHVAKEGETHADLQSRLQTEHPEMRPVANAQTVLSERGYVDENGKFLSAGEARARQAGGTSETVPPTAPTEPNHIAQIVAHSTAKQEAAGVPHDQAVANATVEAHFYDTLSKRFGGKLGSAIDLYNARSAEVVQGGEERAPAVPGGRTIVNRRPEMPGIRTKENGEPVRREWGQIAGEEGINGTTPAGKRRVAAIQDRELGAFAAWQAAERAKTIAARETAREPIPEEKTLAELDARKAPDEDYKNMLSTSTKEPLKAGETWRDRAVKFVDSIKPEERELNQSRELNQEDDRVPLHSAVERAVSDLKQAKGTGEQMLAQIARTPGVKPEEMKWLGLDEWLRGQKSVTKEQIAEYVRANKLDVKEVEKGNVTPINLEEEYEKLAQNWYGTPYAELGAHAQSDVRNAVESNANQGRSVEPDRPRYSGYKLPGGENYRELLITLPREEGAEPYRHSHWEESNVLAHVRFDERTAPDGKRVLMVHEVQSDWHQAGRKQGYKEPLTPEENARFEALGKERVEAIKAYDDYERGMNEPWDERTRAQKEEALRFERRINEINEARRAFLEKEDGGVPDAPFKTTWPALVMKRMIKYAVDNGFDRVAWAPGEVQAERYDLSKQIDTIYHSKNPDGTYNLDYVRGRERNAIGRDIKEEDLERHVGKEIAQKIVEGVGTHTTHPTRGPEQRLENVDLKVGGEGMKTFYDKMLPNETNKIIGKFGGKVGEGEIPNTTQTQAVPDAQARAEHGAEYDRLQAEFEEAERTWRNSGTPERMDEAARRANELYHRMIDETNARQGSTRPVHSFDITDRLRQTVQQEGLPLFQGRRGYIDLDAQRAVIHLLKDANASTFMHETAHHWLEQLLMDSEHPDAPNGLRDDADIVRQWLGVNANEDVLYKGYGKRQLKTRRDAQEKFATGFEQYLREGKAPSKALEGVFAKFKEWLLNIYKTLRGLGTPINDEIKGVFDRMLAHEPEPTVRAETSEHQPSIATVHETDAAETSPRNAENVADRVASERLETASSPPPEVKDELDRAAADAGAENGAGTAGSAEVAGGVPAAEPVSEGGGVGAQPGKVSGGGGKTPAESGGVSAGTERGAGRSNAGSATGPEQLAPRPAEQIPEGSDRLTDRAGNIRYKNITSIEEFQRAIIESSDRNDEFKSRRDIATLKQLSDLAEDMGWDPRTMDYHEMQRNLAEAFGGMEKLAAKVEALRKAVKESSGIVAESFKRYVDTGTDADLGQVAVVVAQHDMMQGWLSFATHNWGQAGNAFRNISEGVARGDEISQLLRNTTGRSLNQLKMIAKLGAKYDTPAKISKWLQDAKKRTFPSMVLEYWINGLISGLATHTTYTVGNELLGLHAAGPETAAAAMIGSIRQKLGRQGERVYMGEVGAQLGAHIRELPAAFQASTEAARTGMTTRLPNEVNVPQAPFAGDAQLALAKNMTNNPVTWREARGDAYALLRGMKDSVLATGALVAKGGEAGAPMFEWRPTAGGAIPDFAVHGINVPMGEFARLPSRMVATIHSFFRATNYSMEINRLAYRTAMDEGHTGTAFDSRVAELRQNPTDHMMERAHYVANERTLMGQGGAFTQALQRLTNVEIGGWKLLKFVDPFVHIASNIMEQALVERTPIGLLSRQIREDLSGKNGNVAQDTAQAKMLVGTALGITFGGLAANGYVTGSGPSDPGKFATWNRLYQPHSVRIGDIYYDMHRLGTMGMLASVSADLFDVSHAISEYESGNVASAIMHAFTQNILDESFMRGPSDLIKAVEEPDRYGSAYIRNMVASFMPYSVAMSQMARAADPYSRQARTLMDTIKQHTPGLSETLLPKIDRWGMPVPNPESMAPGVLAIWMKRNNEDPVDQAMVRLGFAIAPVKREIRNVKLTDEQYDAYARRAGGMLKIRLDTIINSPQWRTMDPSTQHDVVKANLDAIREGAAGWMMMKYPQIPHDAADQLKAKHTATPEPIH